MINKCINDQLVRGNIIEKTFTDASELLDDKTKINQVGTLETTPFPLHKGIHPQRNFPKIKKDKRIWLK